MSFLSVKQFIIGLSLVFSGAVSAHSQDATATTTAGYTTSVVTQDTTGQPVIFPVRLESVGEYQTLADQIKRDYADELAALDKVSPVAAKEPQAFHSHAQYQYDVVSLRASYASSMKGWLVRTQEGNMTEMETLLMNTQLVEMNTRLKTLETTWQSVYNHRLAVQSFQQTQYPGLNAVTLK